MNDSAKAEKVKHEGWASTCIKRRRAFKDIFLGEKDQQQTSTTIWELVMHKAIRLFIFLGIVYCQHAFSMVFDNRFIPLIQRPILMFDNTWSEFKAGFFFTTADKSFDSHQKEIPLPEIFGNFDQAKLAQSFVVAGQTNPLPSEYQSLPEIPWVVEGKRQSQGAVFRWHQRVNDYFSLGSSWLFMRVNSRHRYFLNTQKIATVLEPGDATLLDESRRSIFNTMGIREGNTAQLGFGDIDLYFRLGYRWIYEYRFRGIDFGLRVGGLMPTGQSREQDRPASIPFGGNGHWGAYVHLDTAFELKEDWRVGAFFRVSKRFKNTKDRRMPVDLGKATTGAVIQTTPQPYGVVCGPVEIDPGVTCVVCPWFLLENLRDGLALGLNYTLTWHQKDSWCDARADKSVPVNLAPTEAQSKWASDYFTINALYDFNSSIKERDLHPVVFFRWDVPASVFVTDRINKTHRVTLGLEFVY